MEVEYEDNDVSSCLSPARSYRRNQEPIFAGFAGSSYCPGRFLSSSFSSPSSSSSAFHPMEESHFTPLQPLVTGYKRKYCSLKSGIIDENDDKRENYNNMMYMNRIDRVEIPMKGPSHAGKIITYSRLNVNKLKAGRWCSDAHGEGLPFNDSYDNMYDMSSDVMTSVCTDNVYDIDEYNYATASPQQFQPSFSGLNKIYELNFRKTSSAAYMGIEDGICIFCVPQQQREAPVMPTQASRECRFCNRLSCHQCIVVCSICSHEFCNFCVVLPQQYSPPTTQSASPLTKICHDCNRKSIASSPNGVCKNDIIFF